jgi:Kdo2-lipid IVA lauroyltransferase/acyltransferase
MPLSYIGYLMSKTYLKKMEYWVGDFFGNLFLTISLLTFRRLPPKALVFIARILSPMAFYLYKKYRDRVFSNLSLAFGKEKNLRERRKLAKEVFFNFTLTPLETIYMVAGPFERSVMDIKIKGRENLDAALTKGKGVIALGAHLGSFTMLATRLAQEGYVINIIINQSKFPKLTERLGDLQRKAGMNPFPPKPATTSVKKSLNSLRRNEILYLIADEQQILGGIPVPFFGQLAYTPPGPAIFSLKTGAPILPMFVLREKGIPQTLLIGSPIKIERTFDEKKDIELLVSEFTRVIEDFVRQYPSQWAWLNRRWKLSYQKRSLDMGNREG